MKKQTLKYALVRNTLPEAANPYQGRLVVNGVRDEDSIADRIAAKQPNLQAATVKMVLRTLADVTAAAMAELPCRVSVGEMTFEPAVTGSLPSLDAPLGAENEVRVAVRLSDRLRNAAAGSVPMRVSSEALGIRLDDVQDETSTPKRRGFIAGTGRFSLTGRKITGSGEDEGIKVVAADGTEAAATDVTDDGTGQRVEARLAAALPPGKATLYLTTRGFGSDEDEGTVTRKHTVTILAGETPAGPTFAKVAPQGHENDAEYANKLLRDGMVAIIGTGFTDGLAATFMNGETEETFVVGEVTATKITGTISGGLEVPGTLAFSLKDGDTVIGTATVTVVEG